MTDATTTFGKVIKFPLPAPAEKKVPSIVERASLEEETAKTDLSRVLECQLKEAKTMSPSDRFILGKNLRTFIYSLKDAKRLDIKEIAAKVRGPNSPREVRAIQDYVVPKGIETEEDLVRRHPKRRAANKPAAYMKITLAAADLAKVDRRDAIIALALGSSFMPGGETADAERRGILQIVEILERLPVALSRIFSVERYFDLVNQHRLLPDDRGDEVHFTDKWDFDTWDYTTIPSVPVARRSAETREAILVVSAEPATDYVDDSVFYALLETANCLETTVNLRQTVSLGVGSISNAVRPVAIISHETIINPGRQGKIVENSSCDDFLPGWHRVKVETERGTVWAAWALKDYLNDQSDDEEAFDGEPPPNVQVVAITADWLLRRQSDSWRVAGDGRRGKLWNVFAEHRSSRFGQGHGFVPVLERVLLTENGKDGPLTEIRLKYEAYSRAVQEWTGTRYAHMDARLSRLADSLVRDAGGIACLEEDDD